MHSANTPMCPSQLFPRCPGPPQAWKADPELLSTGMSSYITDGVDRLWAEGCGYTERKGTGGGMAST